MYRAQLALPTALLGLALTTVALCPLHAQSIDVKQILIHSAWGGLGKPASADLSITSDGREFRLGSKRINAALVQAFVGALREPAISAPNLENLGLTHEWLVSNHDGPGSMFEDGPLTGDDNQREYYRQRFEDPTFIAEPLLGILRSVY